METSRSAPADPAVDGGPAGPRPRRDAQRTHRRLVAAAHDVFAARGLSAGLNEVAARAGVGVGTVYRHFPDKQQLIEVALHAEFEALLALVDAGLHARTAWDGLAHVLRESAAMAVANRGLRDVSFGSLRSRDAVRHEGEHLARRLEALLQAARAEGVLRPEVVADDLVMIVLMVSDLAYRTDEVSPGAYRRYLDLVIDGLRARSGGGQLSKLIGSPET